MIDLKKEKTLKILFIIITLIIIFVIGYYIKFYDRPILFDEDIMEYIHSNITEFGYKTMKSITELGSVTVITILTVIISLYYLKNKEYNKFILILLASLGVAGLNQLLKYIFTRTRPEIYFLIKETGYSFPSGHSMVSMSFYSTLFYLFSNRYEKYRSIFLALNFTIVSLIGFSRIYLGVHWPTDVLIGFLLGYIWFICIRKLYKIIKNGNFIRKI